MISHDSNRTCRRFIKRLNVDNDLSISAGNGIREIREVRLKCSRCGLVDHGRGRENFAET